MTARFHSFRFNIAMGFGVAILLLAAVVSTVAGYTSRQRITHDVAVRMADLAHQLADKLDRGMFERYQDIQVAVSMLELRSAEMSLDEKRETIEQLQLTFPDYSWIGLTDVQGTVRAATGMVLEGTDVSMRPWFINGREAPFVGDVHDALLLAPILAPDADEPLRLVDIAIPVHAEDGSLQGVLGSHLNWEWLQEIYASLLTEQMTAQHIELLIVSVEGDLLLAPDDFSPVMPDSIINMLGAGTVSMTVQWGDGEDYLTAVTQTSGYLEYPGLGWYVITRQPTAIAFAPARELIIEIMLLGAVSGIVFIGVGWLLAGRMTKPLQVITEAAYAIRQGDTTIDIPPLEDNAEVASLSRSLQAMLVDLRREKEALRESEANFRTMLDKASQGILLVDAAGTIIMVNRYIEDTFGTMRDTLLGTGIDDLLPEGLRAAHAAMRQEYLAAPVERPMGANRELTALTVDGRLFPVEVSLTPVYLAGELHIMAFLADISERKQLEQQRLYSAQLEIELKKERELMQIKEHFVSLMSHEFRTPLTVIQSSVGFVTSYYDRLPRERVLDKLGTIAPQIHRMVELMEDALRFSRSRSGKTELQYVTIDVPSFTERLVETMRLVDADAHTIRLQSDEGSLCADARLLDHILANLISNALKYSPASTTVSVVALVEGDDWVFKIADEGIGIPDEDIPHLFDPFHRASNVGEMPGTGLGLSIVKDYVELHCGSIAVESNIGHGSVFIVRIPARCDSIE